MRNFECLDHSHYTFNGTNLTNIYKDFIYGKAAILWYIFADLYIRCAFVLNFSFTSTQLFEESGQKKTTMRNEIKREYEDENGLRASAGSGNKKKIH